MCGTARQDDKAGAEEDPFEALAALLRAPATLAAVSGLLRRLEARRAASAASSIHKRRRSAPAEAGALSSSVLGQHKSIPGISSESATAAAGGNSDKAVAAAQAALFPKSHRAGRSIPRYAPRVFLASYMIRVRRNLRVFPSHHLTASPHHPLPGDAGCALGAVCLMQPCCWRCASGALRCTCLPACVRRV